MQELDLVGKASDPYDLKAWGSEVKECSLRALSTSALKEARQVWSS